jgi:hypothetical protein
MKAGEMIPARFQSYIRVDRRYFFSFGKNLVIFVPQVSQTPFAARRPLSNFSSWASFMVRCVLHFTQYA